MTGIVKDKTKIDQDGISIQTAKELVEFADNYDMLMHLTESEAEILFMYMDWREYELAEKNEKLIRLDTSDSWIAGEEYSLDALVQDALGWNEELMEEAQEELSQADNFMEFSMVHKNLVDLNEQREVLGNMYDRSIFEKTQSIEKPVLESRGRGR